MSFGEPTIDDQGMWGEHTMRMTDDQAELAALRHVDRLRKLCAARDAEFAASPGLGPAYRELTAFGQELFDEGGEALMEATYDAATDRFGFEGVRGARSAWTGIGQWSA